MVKIVDPNSEKYETLELADNPLRFYLKKHGRTQEITENMDGKDMDSGPTEDKRKPGDYIRRE